MKTEQRLLILMVGKLKLKILITIFLIQVLIVKC
nr:MAG TPA: hypothetical protein [Caudoviricetes sp.]